MRLRPLLSEALVTSNLRNSYCLAPFALAPLSREIRSWTVPRLQCQQPAQHLPSDDSQMQPEANESWLSPKLNPQLGDPVLAGSCLRLLLLLLLYYLL